MTRWAILTGEYPPQPGGVADYTRLLATGLAKAGDEVHVWSPSCTQTGQNDRGIQIHRLVGSFGPAAILQLHRDLGQLEKPYRILVQYVPHAFGWKAMNFPFCLWLFGQRRAPVWIMFHEVALQVDPSQSCRHNLLGRVTRQMAKLLLRSAERVFVSIPAWETLLRTLATACPPITWLPVPSNIPSQASAEDIARVRGRIAPNPETLVFGHFGTFGALVTPLLREVLPSLLAGRPDRKGLLLGRGGCDFGRSLEQAHASLQGRLIAPGPLPENEVAAHLSACDVLVQPYPDGVSSRRTSLMAGLALGLPIVTTEGVLSEPLWRESGAVLLAPAGDSKALVEQTEALLSDRHARARLSQRARLLYADQFSPDRIINRLRSFA